MMITGIQEINSPLSSVVFAKHRSNALELLEPT